MFWTYGRVRKLFIPREDASVTESRVEDNSSNRKTSHKFSYVNDTSILFFTLIYNVNCSD